MRFLPLKKLIKSEKFINNWNQPIRIQETIRVNHVNLKILKKLFTQHQQTRSQLLVEENDVQRRLVIYKHINGLMSVE